MVRPFLDPSYISDESDFFAFSSSSDEDGEPITRTACRRRANPKTRSPSPSPSHSTSASESATTPDHPHANTPQPGHWNTNYAVAFLVHHLRSSPVSPDAVKTDSTGNAAPAAADAISAARTYPVPPRQWRAYPGLVFPSLSAAVFDGKLGEGCEGEESACEVAWETLDEGVSGKTKLVSGGWQGDDWIGRGGKRREEATAGQKRGRGGMESGRQDDVRVKIELNAVALQGASRDEIVGTLLHHMIHAYLILVCGGVGRSCSCKADDGDGGRGDDEGGEGKELNDDDHLAHGNAFAAILWELRAQAAKNEAEEGTGKKTRPLPIGFGHRLPSAFSQFIADRSRSARFRAPVLSGQGTGTKSSRGKRSKVTSSSPRHPERSTYCPAAVPIITLDAATAWHDAECAPFLSAPACLRGYELYACYATGNVHRIPRSSPASAYVEVIYESDKPISLPRRAVEQFASLAAAFAGGSKRCIEVPRAGVGEKEELGDLMTFLRTGRYYPALRVEGSGSGGESEDDDDDDDGDGGGTEECYGVPIIQVHPGRAQDKGRNARKNAHAIPSSKDETDEQRQTDSPHHLLRDIRMYRLAGVMGFTELAAYALRRLYSSWPVTYEDPINILEAIYPSGAGTGRALRELRAWARSFLYRREEFSGVSNMTKLETIPALKRRWKDLLARSGGGSQMLLEDVRMVHAQETMRRQRWKRRQQYARTYPNLQREQAFHAQKLPAEDQDRCSTIGDESDDGDDEGQDRSTWRDHWDRPPIPPQQHGWDRIPYDYPSRPPFPLAPSAVHFFPYHALPRPYPPYYQRLRSQVQSRCKHSTSTSCTDADHGATGTRPSRVAAAARGGERTAPAASPKEKGGKKQQEGMEEAQKSNGRGRMKAMSSPRHGRGTVWSSLRRRQPRVDAF